MSKKSKKALKKEQRRMEEAERLFLLSEISRVQTRLETKLKFLFNFLFFNENVLYDVDKDAIVQRLNLFPVVYLMISLYVFRNSDSLDSLSAAFYSLVCILWML